METSLTSYREQLIEKLVAFLWGQWSALGVAGHARSDDNRIIDPEALLLFSTVIARHDARLFDEVLDWLQENASRISLQRLGTMVKEERLGDMAVLAAMAEYLTKHTTHKTWKLVIRKAESAGSITKGTVERLFPGVPLTGEPDPIFLQRSLERGKIDLRGMSRRPRTDQPATFLFKLRSLFGRQARAEVVAWLLANDRGHPAAIARHTGYFRRTVQIVLNDLSESGHVRAIRSGREKDFLIDPDEWRFLMTWKPADTFPRWVTWAPVFRFLESVLETLSQPGIDERSERFKAVQLREVLSAAPPSMKECGISFDLRSSVELQGSALVEAVLTDLDQLMGELVGTKWHGFAIR